MTKLLKNRGAVVNSLLVALVGGMLATLGFVSMKNLSWGLALVQPDGQDVSAALDRVSLHPKALAAAGVSDQQVATIVSDARSYLDENLQALRLADSQFRAAKADRDRLAQAVRSGTRDQDTLNALQAAQSAVDAAQGDQRTLLDGLVAAATQSLEADAKASLAAIDANGGRTMPIQYLCIDRSEAQWVELRDALAHVRIAEKHGVEPDQDVQNHIADADADPEVAAAATNLQLNLDSVQNAFRQATDF